MKNVEDFYPLSPLQQGMLFHTLEEAAGEETAGEEAPAEAPSGGRYIEQFAVAVDGPADAERLEAAWQRVVDRHPVLRTSVVWEGVKEPIQVVHRELPVRMARHGWEGTDPGVLEGRFEAFREGLRNRPFDLRRPPLIRLDLVRLGPERHRLIGTFHHILLDAWSVQILLAELLALYGGRLLPPPPRPFRDAITWLRRQDREAARGFWQRQLAGFTTPTPIGPEPRGESPGAVARGPRSAQGERRIPAAASAAFLAAARGLGVTPGSVFQAAWGLLLGRRAGARDVLFGLTVSGRPPSLEGVESMVGLFINTVPCRISFRDDEGACDLLTRLGRRQGELQTHAHAPLVEIREGSDIPRGRSLFESLLVVENIAGALGREAPEEGPGEGELAVRGLPVPERSKVPLTVVAVPTPPILLRIAYDPARFEPTAIEILLRQWERLLLALVTAPEELLGHLPLLSPAEAHQLRLEWNDTALPPPPEATLPGLLAATVAAAPERIALVSPRLGAFDEYLSYGEFHRRARALGAHLRGELRSRGAGPESPVGVALPRSLQAVVAFAAILEAGAFYVPLDLAWPPERLTLLAADAGVDLLVTDPAHAPLLPEALRPHAVLVSATAGQPGPASRPLPAPGGTGDGRGDRLAYLLFTSGSTGTPKGVAVPHRAVVRLVTGGSFADLSPRQTVLAFAPLGFDASTLEIWGPLSQGGRLVLHPEGPASPAELASFLGRHRITALWLTAGLFHRMADGAPEAFAGVGQLLAGGDVLSPQAVRRVCACHPDLALINGYGPTENTTFTCTFPAHRQAWNGPVPIGRPIAGTAAFLTDRQGRSVPAGVPGELLAGGRGLARGYHRRAAATAAAFVPDGFSGAPGERLYKTGDLARHRPDGNLDFLGRIDSQIKVRGFRIEPGEIEATLERHPAVARAVVVARGEGAEGKRLVAYAVPAEAGGEISPGQLRAFLAGHLPEPMVPAALLLLPELPLTPQGKVDRRALPDPFAAAGAGGGGERELPSNPLEEQLAAIWSEVLRVETIGRRDSFFELGGHSLLAMQIVSRVRKELGVDLPLRSFLEHPTVAELAILLAELGPGEGEGELKAGGDGEEGEHPPLSFAQERLWFLDQLSPASPLYNMPLALRGRGRLDARALAEAVGGIVRRHETLRTTFATIGGTAVQRIAPTLPLPLARVDLRAVGGDEREGLAIDLARAEARQPFDLARGPLLRVRILDLGAADFTLLITFHHIVSDGWSMGIFVREFTELYRAVLENRQARLGELPIQYRDFALWQRRHFRDDVLEGELSWWRQRLAGLPPILDLPTDRPRPPAHSLAGGSVPVRVDRATIDGLLSLARDRGATLFMVLLAAFKALLLRHGAGSDLAVGSPIAGRTRPEVEGLIGFFVNTLVMRTDLGGNPPFTEALGRVRESAFGAFRHQNLPFERLVAELAPERHLSASPLFQVLMVLQNSPWEAQEFPGMTLEPHLYTTGTAKFDLTLSVTETELGLEGLLEYRSDLHDRTTILRLLDHFRHLAAGVVARPETPLAELPLLGPEGRHQVLREGDDTAVPVPEVSLFDLFLARAEAGPDAIAVVGETAGREEHLSRAELARRALALAAALRRLGIGPGDPVAFCLPRSPRTVEAILGILAAGAFYVPLDAAWPAERLTFTLEDTAAEWVLIARTSGVDLASATARVLVIDGDGLSLVPPVEGFPGPVGGGAPTLEAIAGPAATGRWTSVGGDALAYVLYTSGSTGRPKGVAVPHRAVARLVLGRRGPGADFLPFREDDTFLLLAPMAFDASTLEIWGPLLNGSRLAVAPDGAHSLSALGQLLARHRVTALWLTAGLFQQMAERELPSLAGLRHLLAGGDVLPPKAVARVLRELPAPRLGNGYGPTENTTFTTTAPLSPEDLDRPGLPIGRPIPGTRVQVVDRRGEPTPLAVPGELLAGGAGLARGYYRRPAATAEAFRPDALTGAAGARLYHTGDRVRRLADGRLEFLGRIDRQVKIRGFRIEPGEIEAVLKTHPAVREAVVLVRGEGAGDKYLLAWAVPTAEGVVDAEALRAHLARHLPAYMVPGDIHLLAELPLSPTGKVERRHLPEPPRRREAGQDEAEARPGATPAEEIIRDIWAGVLGRERVGPDDNFFDLGGHSLLATRAISHMRELLGVDLPLQELFEHPTPAAVAGRVSALLAAGESGEALPPIGILAREERGGDAPSRPPIAFRAPVSLGQRRLWFLAQLDPSSPAYNMPVGLGLAGRLDPRALAAAFAGVVARHESLRTTFELDGGEPVQVIAPVAGALAPLPVLDLSALPPAAARSVAATTTTGEGARPFDLARGPLLRSVLLRLGKAEHQLLFTVHHIVSDGWSMGVMIEELAALYRAELTGQAPALAPPPLQYADFAAWQRRVVSGEHLERQLGWWRQRLAAPAVLDLPTDHPRPAVQTFRGERISLRLGPELSADLEKLARREGSTLFMVLLAAFQVLMGRLGGSDRVRVGTPIAGRNRRELEGLVGFFVSTLVLGAELGDRPSFRQLLARVREEALGAFAHQDLPFERLVEELAPERDLSRTPLFQVFFNMVNLPRVEAELPGLKLTAPSPPAVAAKFDLTVYAGEESTGLHLNWVYNGDLFTPERVIGWSEQYRSLLTQIVAAPERPVDRLSLRLAEGTTALGAPGPPPWAAPSRATWPGSVIHRFAGRARLFPERVAVVDARGTWTCGALETAAHRLARQLREAGVEEEDIVALHGQRGALLLAAVLAVLEAGGAFLILDPAWPPERLRMALGKVRPKLLLELAAGEGAAGDVSELLPRGSAHRRLTDADLNGIGRGRLTVEAPNGVEIVPESLAYVAFTSGSTGEPRGVLGTHQPLAHFIAWHVEAFGLTPVDRFSCLSGLGHDPLLRDLFTPLWLGAVLVVPDPAELATPGYLRRWLAERAVTLAHLTPPMTRLLAVAPAGGEGAVAPALRQAFFGGDVLTRADLARLAEVAPRARAVNFYGATETPQAMGYHRLRGDGSDPDPAPVGRGIAGVDLHILNRAGDPAGIGEVGEIAIVTGYLARGYLGEAGATARRFLPAPEGGRYYATGDLGRFRPDGAIDFLGRADRQIKIRGFRVEPAEIEAVLAAHPGVREAAVLARSGGDDTRLIACVVPAGAALPATEELLAHLRRRLPEAMVPSLLVPLESLPLTGRGKLDRAALAALDVDGLGASRRRGAPVAPRSELERTIAGIWREVLGLSELSVDDRFFDVGGHSLKLVEIRARLEAELGRPIALPDFFNHPTVAALAAHLSREAAERRGEVGGEMGSAAQETLAQAEVRAGEMAAARDRRAARRRRIEKGEGTDA